MYVCETNVAHRVDRYTLLLCCCYRLQDLYVVDTANGLHVAHWLTADDGSALVQAQPGPALNVLGDMLFVPVVPTSHCI